MKTKGRRMSYNVEKAMTFGQPRRKNDPTYKDVMSKGPKYVEKLEQMAKEEMATLGQAPRTKQMKENIVHNYLNAIHRAGRTPMPSPRGKTPPTPRGPNLNLTKPGKTDSPTTRKMLSGMDKALKNSQPSSFETRKGKPDPIRDVIDKDKRLEELRKKAQDRNAKRGGKQDRLRPKYDKKTGKKLP